MGARTGDARRDPIARSIDFLVCLIGASIFSRNFPTAAYAACLPFLLLLEKANLVEVYSPRDGRLLRRYNEDTKTLEVYDPATGGLTRLKVDSVVKQGKCN
jgi:hypothetical protein